MSLARELEHEKIRIFAEKSTAVFGLARRFYHEDNGQAYGELETGATRLAFASLELAKAHLKQDVVAASTDQAPLGVEIALVAPDVPALYARAWSLYQRHYLAVNGEHSNVYPGVLEGLEWLAASGFKLACLTNKPTGFAVPLLHKKGLDGFFSAVFGGDAFERKKPDPLPLIRSCEALGSAPARTLMVGDSSNDARAARAAGCPVVLVSYGYNHGEPVSGVDADGVVDRLDQLDRLIKGRA